MTDPGDAPGSAKTSDEEDRELAALAADYQSRGRRCWRVFVELTDDGTARDINAAAKMSAESAKWERLFVETKDRLAQRKHLRESLEKRAAMSGKRGNN